MDLGIQRYTDTRVSNSLSCFYTTANAKTSLSTDYGLQKFGFITSKELKGTGDLETSLIQSIVQDDKVKLASLSRFLLEANNDTTVNRETVSKLLHLCCAFDSIDCAASLLTGELGVVPLVNKVDGDGLSPLHAAATAQAARCVDLLLRKHARTDLKTKDGRSLLPLELSLYSSRLDVIWNPDSHSIEDLVVQLREKDLMAVKLLSEKTKEIDEVAYATAIGGRVVDLAALLVVAAQIVNQSILELHDADSGCKEKTSVYECVIREALAIGRTSNPSRAAKRNCSPTESEVASKRKLLLCEIELLQLFGAVAQTGGVEKVTSPLILASQAQDEAVIELLLKSSIDINDADAEGNSALHWCLKTSKGSCPQQIKIMQLLLKHGSRVNQKNKLGLTAVHIAAANGNSQALKILLLEEPDCINAKTEIKETALFFAVKNDCKECAEVLLHCGASTEVHNLRKQRPIDLAESQDMRFILNSTNISLTNHPIRQKYTAWLQGDEVISETCEDLLTLTDEGHTADRTCSSTKTEVCRYFDSPGGCYRGSKCFYVHTEEELRQKLGKEIKHSSIARELKRKVFVGGLPSSLDCDSIGKYFEEQFGPVEDAVVVGLQTGDKVQSRGFGFVTFTHEKSVSAAVEARYITILGKPVEIKSAIPKCLLSELKKSPQQHEQENNDQHVAQVPPPRENTTKEMPSCHLPFEKTKTDTSSWQKSSERTEKEVPSLKTTGTKSEVKSWAETLMHGQPKAFSDDSQIHHQSIPTWLRSFKKWLPHFLEQVSKREGEYALSSLKADFRAAFGLELDHASLGFTKLSDFMRCFPELGRIKFVPIGRQKSANHMILLPPHHKTHRHQLSPVKMCNLSSRATSTTDSGDSDSSDANGFQDIQLASNKNDDMKGTSSKSSHETPDKNPEDTSRGMRSRFLQFLQPDPIFHARPWLLSDGRTGQGLDKQGQTVGYKGMQPKSQESNLVLEALARKRNNSSVYFLREFDFYNKHKESLDSGTCFGCNRGRLLWANFPCRHLLWCVDCKLQATTVASGFGHKCVVCDAKVEKIDLVSWHDYHQHQRLCDAPQIHEFLPFDPDYIRNLSKKNSLSTGEQFFAA